MSSQYRDGFSVSVVIPTYNRAAFLPAAVASIRAQSRACDEIVIVDDGSRDDTREVVARLGAGVRYLPQANAGPAAARNRGIEAARGTLVAFLDTDDRWLPQKIERQLALFSREPALALVAADMAIEDNASGQHVASNFARRGLKACFDELDGRPVPQAPQRLLKLNFINTSTVLARREVLQALGGFDTRLRYGEDLELWLRIAARHPIACEPSVQEIRVEHASNVTKSVEPMLLGYVRMAEVIREWAREPMVGWGLSADRYVADALVELGYWYFSQQRWPEARAAF
ncbi:MAG: glycosyltransferase family 2 protein, partial [Burkholderiales bacterium]|nr:glycosyltransferase family 2 protein [Burkholderiales bacterium]